MRLYVGLSGAVARLAGSVVPVGQLHSVRRQIKIMVPAYKYISEYTMNRDNQAQAEHKTEINQSAFDAALKMVRKIEKEHDEFTFEVMLDTDEFAPRAKRGETLIMQRNIEAEDGDIVAIGKGDDLINQIAWYVWRGGVFRRLCRQIESV